MLPIKLLIFELFVDYGSADNDYPAVTTEDYFQMRHVHLI